MGILDDYTQSQAIRKSAVHDLIDAGSTPLWKRQVADAMINSAVDAIGSAMPLIHDNSVARLSSMMGTRAALDVESPLKGLAGAIDSHSKLTDVLQPFRQSLGLDSESSYSKLMNFVPVGLEALAPRSSREIYKDALQSISRPGISPLRDAAKSANAFSSLAASRGGMSAIAREFLRSGSSANLTRSILDKEDHFSDSLTDTLEEILESAEAFEQEYAGTEVEEAANEFLDDHAVIANQVHGSPFLRTLTLRQRRTVAAYLAFLVYIVFVSAVAIGDSEYPEQIHLLEIFGIDLAPFATGAATYKASKGYMDRHLAARDDE